MNHERWKIRDHIDVSPSPWFPVVKDVVELPNGQVTEYFVSKLADVAMVLPVTKQKEIIFVRQYKHGVGEVCLELPAGRIKKDQAPRTAAVAELAEETGIVIDESTLVEIAELWTEPSKSAVRVHGFLALEVEISQLQDLEETEYIEVVAVPIAQLDSRILGGEVHASDSLALLTMAQVRFPEIFSRQYV